jgi:hypothetical protein
MAWSVIEPMIFFASYVSARAKGFGLEQDKDFPIRCSVGTHMTVEPPALAAVAIYYVHQRLMNFEPDRSTEASTRCHRSRIRK